MGQINIEHPHVDREVTSMSRLSNVLMLSYVSAYSGVSGFLNLKMQYNSVNGKQDKNPLIVLG